MAFEEYIVDRVTQILKERKVPFFTKKMFGGLCIMVDEKMLLGIDKDKSTDENRLMCRVGGEFYEEALTKDYCSSMNMTGKAMKGFVFVSADGFDMQKDLEYWIDLCLSYNPFAKKSKKKKK